MIPSYHSNNCKARLPFRRRWRHQSSADCTRRASRRRRWTPSEKFVLVFDNWWGRIGAYVVRPRQWTLWNRFLFPQSLQARVHVERSVIPLGVTRIHWRRLTIIWEGHYRDVLYDIWCQCSLRRHGGWGWGVSSLEPPDVAQWCWWRSNWSCRRRPGY